MKILLFGEYSGFYNALKEGLLKNGHTVLLTGRNDGFKNYPLDLSLEPTFFKKRIPNIFRQIIYKLTKHDISGIEIFFKFMKNKNLFKNHDIVHLINERPFQINKHLEIKLLKYIFKNNKNVFLSACSDDYLYINYLLKNKHYNILTPYFNNKKLKKHFKHTFKYLSNHNSKIHNLVFNNIKAVVPTDFDYVMAYRNHYKSTHLIPYPIKINSLKYSLPELSDEIIIFHGINRVNYYKKGNDVFEKALEIIQNKYNDKIDIITVESLPYKQYIESYNKAHILLDQVYAYDQGYNALEAMAKGKVVFTGAEQEWLQHFNLKPDTVAINTIPNPEYIAKKLEWLILNPKKIIEISKNARTFIEEHHNCNKIAKLYEKVWDEII